MPKLDLPDIRSGKVWWACGATCVEIVCKSLGVKASREQIRSLVKPNSKKGNPPRQLIRCLKELGFEGAAGSMELEDLGYYTRRGIPVICAIQSALGYGHYAVVEKLYRGSVVYQDPDLGPCWDWEKDFADKWKDWSKGNGGRLQYLPHYGIAVWR